MEENVEATGGATASCLKRRQTFCPISLIRPVTARPAPQ